MLAPRHRVVPILIAVAIFVAACESTSRPNAVQWQPGWEDMVEVVPEQVDLGSPPDRSICQSTLTRLREENSDLFPTPSVTVDDLVHEWVSIAETAFFECPPDGEELGSFSDAYNELSRLEESVETALES